MRKELRVVVSKDAKKKRQTKTTNYSLRDAYEVSLLNFAEREEHGDYSKFIKRLVGQEMRRREQQESLATSAFKIEEEEKVNDDLKAMSGFL